MDQERLDHLFGQYVERLCSPAEVRELLAYFGSADEGQLLALIRSEMEADHELTVETAEQAVRFERIGERINAYIDAPVFKMRRLVRYAAVAAIAVIFAGAYLFRIQLLNTVDPIHQLAVVTQKGERKELQLADGTAIWLGPDSKLTYPEKFRGEIREIKISGEAFLEVKHDQNHPFIVRAGKLRTQVLGTSFDVKAYPNDQTAEVILLSGKVAVMTASQQAIITPNQRVLFAANKIVAEDYPEAQSLLDRRAGNLAYKHVPLPNVIQDLERHFNLSITLDKRMQACKFTGQFKAGEKAESILQQITAIYNATYKKTATNHYTVTGKSCN